MMTDAMQVVEDLSQEEFDAKLPTPVGYRVLVAMPQVEKTFADSLIQKSSRTMHEENIMSTIGLVVDMGKEAFADKERFPSGPWCQTGDYVMFRMNTGTRFKFGDVEYRLMNDDSIQAVIPDPKLIEKV